MRLPYLRGQPEQSGFLLRKKWAVPLFLLSFLAVLIQFTYPFIIAGGLSTLGATALIFPAFIILVAIVQWRFAVASHAAGKLI